MSADARKPLRGCANNQEDGCAGPSGYWERLGRRIVRAPLVEPHLSDFRRSLFHDSLPEVWFESGCGTQYSLVRSILTNRMTVYFWPKTTSSRNRTSANSQIRKKLYSNWCALPPPFLRNCISCYGPAWSLRRPKLTLIGLPSLTLIAKHTKNEEEPKICLCHT